MEINENTFNNLLKPLGFHLTYLFGTWKVYDMNEYIVYEAGINSVFTFFEDAKIINIWNTLKTAQCFYGNNRLIENPYCNCKSLEEALVKKDLMYDGN